MILIVKKNSNERFDHVGSFKDIDTILSSLELHYEKYLNYLINKNPELYFMYISNSRIDGTNMYKVDITSCIRDSKISEILK